MNYEPTRLSKLLLVALLCTHEKVGGVQCFAGAGGLNHRTSRAKPIGGIGIGIGGEARFNRRKNDLNLRHMVASSTAASFDDDKDDEIKNAVPSNELSVRGGEATTVQIKNWPCGDALDKKLIKIALPCIANFAITPLVGAVDLFWINRMGNTLAVAGQAAANQIFTSAFWLTSFLPSVTATLVATESAKGSEEGVQDAVCQALVLGTFVAVIGSVLIFSRPDKLLSGVLKNGAPAREFAKPYLLIRAFGFLPSLYSLIGFSAFRGKISLVFAFFIQTNGVPGN